jgi:hypothetical protein
MTFDDACKFLGERFLTSRPKRSELTNAYRHYIAHGENVNTETMGQARKAMNVIWEHWYSHVEFRSVGDRYRCIDNEHGIYGESSAKDEDAAYWAYEHMVVNRLPLQYPEEGFDWRTACLKILNGVGEAEGVWFEDEWKMKPEAIEKIRNEYARWMQRGEASIPGELNETDPDSA